LSFTSNHFAFETDQYNLPPVPLADISDEVSTYIEQNIIDAANDLNDQIAAQQSCLANVPVKLNGCGSINDVEKKLGYLRSNDAVAFEVYQRLGKGSLFITKTGKWFNNHKFSHTPDRWKPDFKDSFFIFVPLDYATISPTINMYGVEFGYDKVEHLLQQGFKYYSIKQKAIAQGSTATEAEKKAVDWGKKTERTYFGLLVSGVYSNGDLFANYIGMKFYEGLTQPLTLGDTTRPATLNLIEGKWRLNDEANLHENLLKPLINDRLNEALNPSGYSFNLFPTVRRVVRSKACPQWQKLLPNAKKADLEMRSASLETWDGIDYGFNRKGKPVPIAACFD
jgi:hypothetical protein